MNREHSGGEHATPFQAEVTIVGAGPGDPELLTLKGKRLLETADLVVYAGSLVAPALLTFCTPSCERVDSASLDLEEQVELMSRAALEGRRVVRLHTGDPSLYGATAEQIRELEARGVGVTIVPGVSSLQAAAARLGVEYTVPGGTQTVICTRAAGRTPVPASESLERLAASQSTLVIFLSAGQADQVANALLRGGYAPDTPSACVYRATWPDERILRTRLDELARRMDEAGIANHALLVIGSCLAPGEAKSLLYDGSFSHGFRNAERSPLS